MYEGSDCLVMSVFSMILVSIFLCIYLLFNKYIALEVRFVCVLGHRIVLL